MLVVTTLVSEGSWSLQRGAAFIVHQEVTYEQDLTLWCQVIIQQVKVRRATYQPYFYHKLGE